MFTADGEHRTASTSPALDRRRVDVRRSASKPITAASASSVASVACAERISARRRP